MSRPRDTPLIEGEVPESVWHIEPLAPRRHNRPKINRVTRERVYARDRGRCRKCGATEDLTIDHIRPLSKGGKNAIANMQTLCWDCNHSKGNSWPKP